jgi:hypothetical protein
MAAFQVVDSVEARIGVALVGYGLTETVDDCSER